ncbi:hypothetical protein [Methanoplanus limicola]|nr:hypothetical protein [Methanoplanus limicola]
MAESATTVSVSNISIEDENNQIVSIFLSELGDFEMLKLYLSFDPSIVNVKTVRVNNSVIQNSELLSDTKISNGAQDTGSLSATIKFSDTVSLQNNTPVLDIVFCPTNKSGYSYNSVGSSYLKSGASEFIQVKNSIDGQIFSKGFGEPLHNQGTLSAPNITLKPGFQGTGIFDIKDVDEISYLYIKFSYLDGIYLDCRKNETFSEFTISGQGGGSGWGGKSVYYEFKSDNNVNITDTRSVLDFALTPLTEGIWDIEMGQECSYSTINEDGIPIEYPFKTLNNGSIQVIENPEETMVKINNCTISSNQSVVSSIEVNNLTNAEMLKLYLSFDPSIVNVKTVRVNNSVIQNSELLSDTKISNGAQDTGSLSATIKFSDTVSLQNNTPVLDIVFCPTNKSGYSYNSVGSSYLKSGASEFIQVKNSIDGQIFSKGFGEPLHNRGTLSAPNITLKPRIPRDWNI